MHVENLKSGMFVVVTWMEAPEVPHNPFGFMAQGTVTMNYSGVPLEVLEVSLPFVCVNDGHNTFAIDSRVVVLTEVTARYAKRMRGADSRSSVVPHCITSKNKPRKAKAEPDEKVCERCGALMCERLLNPGSGKWFRVCPNCGPGGIGAHLRKPE